MSTCQLCTLRGILSDNQDQKSCSGIKELSVQQKEGAHTEAIALETWQWGQVLQSVFDNSADTNISKHLCLTTAVISISLTLGN